MCYCGCRRYRHLSEMEYDKMSELRVTAKEFVSQFSQSMTVKQEMLMIFNAIIVELISMPIERRLWGSIMP